MTSPDTDLRQRIAAHPFLARMTAHQLEIIGDCVLPAHFATDEIVFRAGDPAKGFFLIETGRIAVEGAAEDGTPIVIDVVEAGDPLGWSWIFEPFHCEYTARALAPATAIFVDAAYLAQHRAADLTLSHELFKRTSRVMVRRLTAARAKLLGKTGGT